MDLYSNFFVGLCVQAQPDFTATFPEKILSRLIRIGVRGYRFGFWGVEGSKDQLFAALDRYYPRWRENSIEVL